MKEEILKYTLRGSMDPLVVDLKIERRHLQDNKEEYILKINNKRLFTDSKENKIKKILSETEIEKIFNLIQNVKISLDFSSVVVLDGCENKLTFFQYPNEISFSWNTIIPEDWQGVEELTDFLDSFIVF